MSAEIPPSKSQQSGQGPTRPTEGTQAAPRDAIPAVIDLKDARRVTPVEAPIGKPPFVVTAGVSLARWVLSIMALFVLVALIWIWSSEASYAEKLNVLISPEASVTKEALESLLKQQSDFREFWLKIFQMVLLNVLLPVLTALLGYVFSSTREQNRAS